MDQNQTAEDIAVRQPESRIRGLIMERSMLIVGEPYANRGNIVSIDTFGPSSFIVKFEHTRNVYIVPSRAVTIIDLEVPDGES